MKMNNKLFVALFLTAVAFGLKANAEDYACPVCPYHGLVKAQDIKESVEVLHQYALNCQRDEVAQERVGNKALRDHFDMLKISWGSYENLKMNNVDAFYAQQAQHTADMQAYQEKLKQHDADVQRYQEQQRQHQADLAQYNCTYYHTDCPAGSQ